MNDTQPTIETSTHSPEYVAFVIKRYHELANSFWYGGSSSEYLTRMAKAEADEFFGTLNDKKSPKPKSCHIVFPYAGDSLP